MEEQKMSYYITVTDTNSRQYNFQIPEEGIQIWSEDGYFTVDQVNPEQKEFIELLAYSKPFAIKNAVFNSEHIVTIQYMEIPEGTM